MISPHSINQLLQTVPIEDLVGDYVKLKRSGSGYKGNCPFHDEKTPSFSVTPSLNIYKCFGCQKGGNSIQFLMEIEQLTFVESARELAKRFGVELVETDVDNSDEAMQSQREKESLQALNEFVLQYFESQLHDSEEGQSVALPYFKERGYTIETIKKWRLGYSPSGWTAFYDYAKNAGYSDELLQLAGLIKPREKDGSFYDLFRNRVMFPLIAISGKTIGFAGRIMGNVDKAPKYVNSPETPLYKKSDFLFAVFQAKNAIRKEDKALLMEGYTDVMTLHQAGIENAVASSGTALTPGQIRLIKRFTDNATAVYDGDAAGMKASLRGIDLLLEEGLNVRVVTMPEGQDPDSYCKELGPEKFKQYLVSNEENFIVFKAKLLFKECGNDPIKRSEALRDILQSVALINDILKRDSLVKELERICDTSSAILHSELSKLLRKKRIDQGRQVLKEVDLLINNIPDQNPIINYSLNDFHQEKALLKLMIRFGAEPFNEEKRVVDFIFEELDSDHSLEFLHDENVEILNFLREHYEENNWPNVEEWIQHPNLKLASFAATVFSQEHTLSSQFEKSMIYIKNEGDQFIREILDVFLNMRRTKIEEIIIKEQLKLADPDEDPEQIMTFLDYLNTKKLEIAKELGAVVSR
jgi:DNA primase